MSSPRQHPHWCDRPANEDRDEAHSTKPIPINPGGDELTGVSVRFMRTWLFGTAWIMISIVEDGEEYEHPLTVDQGRVLDHAVRRLLPLADQ